MEMQYQLNKKQEFFQQAVRELTQRRISPRVADIDRAADFPQDVVDIFRQNHLFGLLVPKECQGEGAGFLDLCVVLEELSKVCPLSGLICAVQNLGSRLILVHGSEEQKRKYLSKIATGQAIYGFGLNEAAALDLDVVPLTAVLDGIEYVLNGNRYFITNGDAADVVCVFAKVASSEGKSYIDAFLVEKGTAGFSVTKTSGLTGTEARYTCQGVFKDCRIPKGNLLGREGEGMSVLVSSMTGISCGTAARAVGLAQGALNCAIEYAKQRVQFGVPIAHFQAIQAMLGSMATKIEAARQLVYKAASLMEQESKDISKFAAMAKYFASDVAKDVTTDAVQIFGGYGYMKDYPVERLMRNAQLAQAADGVNHAQQVIVGRYVLA